MDAERVEGFVPLGVAVERAEVEADVVDRSGRDGEVVALGPDVPRPSSETEPRNGRAIRLIISPRTSVEPTPRASVLAATSGEGSPPA